MVIKTKNPAFAGFLTCIMKIREVIIREALNHFLKNGSKIITMDDIATEFGLSKKTLYNLFENKETLVAEAVHLMWNNYMEKVNTILSKEENPIQKIILIYEDALAVLNTVEPVFIVSLRKYHSKVMHQYADNRNTLITKIILPLLEEAQNKSYIASNVNLMLFCDINLKDFDERIWKNNFLHTYSTKEASEYFIIRRLRGILSNEFIHLAEIK